MEGGRGGGRGKGKKSKAAKKKAAAAAKKVPANSSNVQAVAVSTAPEAAAAHEPMAKSKRKRLKKAAAAANALLKAANANVQQVKKSPTASSPKPKVAVLTQTSTAAARPQLVSLSGKKKKKRKRSTLESEENVAVASAKEEQTSEAKKSPSTKKKIVVLSHSGASPTIAKTRPVQLNAESKESTAKAVKKVLSPRKMVKKVKAKAAVVSSQEAESVVHKKTEKKQNVVVGASKSTVVTTSPKTSKLMVPLTHKSDQVNVEETSACQLTHTPKEGKKHESCSTSLMNHVVAAPKKVSAKESDADKDLASASSATVNDKPSHAHAVVSAPATFSKPADTSAVVARASSTPEQATAQGSVPTGATDPANVPAKTIPEPVQPAEKKVSPSSKLPRGSLKRRRSVDPVSTNTSPDSIQPSAKRILVSSEVSQPIAAEETGSREKRASTPDLVPQTEIQQITSTPQTVKAEVKSTDTSTQVEGEAASSKKTLSSARLPPSQKPVREVRSTTQSLGKRPLKPAFDRKKSPVWIQGPIGKQIKPQVAIDTGTSSALSKIKDVAADSKAPSGRVSNSSTVGIALDSHAYVEKMMKSELDTKKSGGNRDNPEQQVVTLPTRPQNAWGASFGMAPPSTVATAPARALSTTPLSSWFLSKGCANFVKHVHFSDDEDDSSNSGDFTGRTPTPRMSSKSSPKWRASSAKKNAFLESLTAHSNWRTWYGEVDEHNLLDPPLAHIPEELRTHEVMPLTLPEPVAADTLTKKTSELEMLETDIKREKQRGLAFSEQLLMMLQGKTVSGKLLGDEYKALLH